MKVIDIVDIKKVFEKSKNSSVMLEQLEQLVKAALLDPDDSIRLSHVKTLNRLLRNALERGFALDNQLYINVRLNNSSSVTYLICDMPKTYLGSPSKPHKFYRK